jgi:hypothetical protein
MKFKILTILLLCLVNVDTLSEFSLLSSFKELFKDTNVNANPISPAPNKDANVYANPISTAPNKDAKAFAYEISTAPTKIKSWIISENDDKIEAIADNYRFVQKGIELVKSENTVYIINFKE